MEHVSYAACNFFDRVPERSTMAIDREAEIDVWQRQLACCAAAETETGADL